jgi:hypothetical protein
MQELVSLQAALAQPAFEKAVAYSRSVYEIASQTQDEFSKIFDSQYVEMNKNVSSVLDKAAKQVAEMAEANVAAATTATVKAVGTAAKSKKAA